MELVKEGNIFVAKSTFAEKDIPKSAKFRWDPDRKRWWTQFPENAYRLINFATGEAKDELVRWKEETEEKLEASQRVSSEVDIPHPEGIDYFPFQKAGIEFAMKSQNILIGDEMGLGKTIQAIGVINVDPSIFNVVVICPASLKRNWERELKKWLVRDIPVHVVNSSDVLLEGINIINYDILTKFPGLQHFEWDLVVVDECHKTKNPKAKRTKATHGLKARRKIYMTGTPIVNRPIELWPIVNTLAPDIFPSFFPYAKRYCNAQQGRYGWDFSGASNLDELQRKLRMSIMVRRLKRDVLTELPPKVRQIIAIDGEGEILDLIEREKRAYERVKERLEELQARVDEALASGDDATYKEAVRLLRQGNLAAFTEMARERHDVAVAKIPYVIEHLNEVLESNGKVVVMAHHHDVVEGIRAAFPDTSVVLTGETPMEERQRNVDRFQNDPSIQLFIGSITAAGVGITLTAASKVVFAELDWVPGNLTQAEDRCHRIGQHDSVLVQHIVMDGSLDAHMAYILVNKQEVIEQAMDDVQMPEVIPFQEVKKDEEVKAKPAPDVDMVELQRKKDLVLHGLRMIAGMCDGARSLDGCGFNKFDTRIGKSLASCSNLSDKQYKFGKKLVIKYQRQLPAELVEEIKG